MKEILPENTKLMAVIQCTDYKIGSLLYGQYMDLGVEAIAFNHSSTAYQDFFPHENISISKMMGRIYFINQLKKKNIIDISKDLSKKYQTMIENGDVNMGDLLSGVLGLINNPDSLNGEFDDIDVSKLPDPDSILKDMANDPKLKEVMGMMGNNKGMPDMGMFGSMMANMVNSNTNTDDKSISDLEKEIEQMMREVQEAETDHNKDVD